MHPDFSKGFEVVNGSNSAAGHKLRRGKLVHELLVSILRRTLKQAIFAHIGTNEGSSASLQVLVNEARERERAFVGPGIDENVGSSKIST